MEKTDGDRLHAAINDGVRERTDVIETFSELDSTNSYLLSQVAPENGRCRIAIADHQTAGRGQRGNLWESPRESGLYLSCAYTFPAMPRHFSNLTLAIAIEIAEALFELGANCKLKWPNDLILHNGKLGGILTETYAGNSDAITVVVGIGINLDLGEQRESIGTTIGRVSDLKQAIPELPQRAEIAKPIIEHAITALVDFETEGFSSFQERWAEFDWLFGKDIRVSTAQGDLDGEAAGIDNDGALMLKTGKEIERIVSGTVALR
jgi:BirA family biotin operon repressor/biotin-[acetyl-CoA-carboxylase] ligase